MTAARFTDRLRASVARLVAHPRVIVEILHLGRPTDATVLAVVERHIARPLPAALRALYESCSRVQLLWRFARADEPDHTEPPDTGLLYTLDEYAMTGEGGYRGAINILSADEVFVTADWAEQVWFPGDEGLNNDTLAGGRAYHRRDVRPFDTVDHYTQIGFLVQPGHTDLPLLYGGDYFAEVALLRLDVAQYLELLVENLGYQGPGPDPIPGSEAIAASLGLRNPYREPVYPVRRR